MELDESDEEMLALLRHLRLRDEAPALQPCTTCTNRDRLLNVICTDEQAALEVVGARGLLEQVYTITGCCEVTVWVGNDRYWVAMYDPIGRV